MIKIAEMNNRERKVFDSVYNGWYMCGKYRVIVGDCEKEFWADSLPILYNDVSRWLALHERSHGEERVLVKCDQVL